MTDLDLLVIVTGRRSRRHRRTSRSVNAAVARARSANISVEAVDSSDSATLRMAAQRGDVHAIAWIRDGDVVARDWLALAIDALSVAPMSLVHAETVIVADENGARISQPASDDAAFDPLLTLRRDPWRGGVIGLRETFAAHPVPNGGIDQDGADVGWMWNADTLLAGVTHRTVPTEARVLVGTNRAAILTSRGFSGWIRSMEASEVELDEDLPEVAPRPDTTSFLRQLAGQLRATTPRIDHLITASLRLIRTGRSRLVGRPDIGRARLRREALAAQSAIEACGGSVDVLYVMPWLRLGGADKVAGDWIRAVQRLRPAATIGVLTTESVRDAVRLDLIPSGVARFAIGAFRLGDHSAAEVVATIAAQLRPRTLHILNSVAGFDAVVRHGRELNAAGSIFLSTYSIDRRPGGGEWSPLMGRHPDYLRFVTGLLTDSRQFAGAITRRFRVPPDLIRVVPHSIDVPPTARKPMGFDPGRPLRIVWFGRFDLAKRLDRVADIAEEAERRHLPVEFHVFGAPVLHDDPNLATTLDRLQQSHVVRHAPADGFAGIGIDDFDVALLTSDYEGTPLGILEVMMSGTPVIATTVGGVQDLIDEATGYPIEDPSDIGAYGDAIAAIIADPVAALDRAAAARQRSLRHSPAAFLASVEAIPGYLPPFIPS